MEFVLLGPVRAQAQGRPVDLGMRKQRLVLAILLLGANRLVTVPRLVRACWTDDPPATARRIIHTHICRLRAALATAGAEQHGVSISRHGPGYVLTCDPMLIDVHRFRRLVDQARRTGTDEEKIALLGEALGLWRGVPLADAAADGARAWLCPGLEETRLAAMADRWDAQLRLGQHLGLVDELVERVAEYPQQQRMVGQLMLALYRSGRAADALETYRQHRQVLVGEFGMEPGAELRQLEVAILRTDPALDRPTEPPRGHPPVEVPAQLPADIAGFAGRTREIDRLDGFLPEGSGATPIVAITGMAGVGKTALAVHWGHRLADRFPDGQLYVDLHGYSAGPPVRPIRALAQFLGALGVDRVPGELDEAAAKYRSLLAGRRMLVVLDNASSADQVRPLLPGSPNSVVLITSRDRLGGLVAREGARRVPVNVLEPAEAWTLLARTLGDERIDTQRDDAWELARLCAYLPLALRIAAGDLLNHPDRTLAAQLVKLGEGRRLAALEIDGDEFAAVRVTFEASYAALVPADRRLFRLLGLVPGPTFDAPAAAALAGIPVEVAEPALDRLAGAHLLEPLSGRVGAARDDGGGRYRFHDLLRLYARERAGTDDTASERTEALRGLFAWYLRTVDAAARVLYPQMLRLPFGDAGSTGFVGATEALAWLDGQRDNLIVAIAQHGTHGMRAQVSLLADMLRGYFWLRRLTTDWLTAARCAAAATAVEGDPCGQAAAALNLADAYQCLGRCEEAIEEYGAVLKLTERAGWLEARAAALGNLGIMHYELGQLTEAADLYRQALELDQKIGWRTGEAVNLANLATVYRELGRPDDAAEQYARALPVFAETGSRYGEADAESNLGIVYHELGRLDEALEHLDRGLAIHREIGERYGEANTLNCLAAVHGELGRPDSADELVRAALAMAEDMGARRTEGEATGTLAALASARGEHRRAADLYERALGMAREARAEYPEVQALIGLAGEYQSLGRTEDAAYRAREALALARRAGLRGLERRARSVLSG
jgi:tetratricopeptide (TPR) repeat protein